MRVENEEKAALVDDAHRSNAAVRLSVDFYPATLSVEQLHISLNRGCLTEIILGEGVIGAGL